MDRLNMLAALPEMVLLLAASLVLLGEAYATRKGGTQSIPVERTALIAILAPLFATIAQVGTPVQYAFDAMYVSDDFARLLKICAYLAVATTLVYARGYVADRGMNQGAFYGLGLFALLGQMVMISANNMLVVYLGLELMSLSLYTLAALRRDSGVATEAAIKYFVLGALASGFLLYGMSMIYGGTGSLDLPVIAKAFATGSQANHTVLVFGVVFIVAGLAFKFGAVPFHMWVPDVYQGTPTAVTLMIAGAPKLAAFAIAFRMLVEGLTGVAGDWQQMLTVLSVSSLVIGNLVAIAQTNLKRMLAYSTIAQIGFLLLGLLSGVVDGGTESAADAYGSSMFYAITYVLTTLGTFGLIQLLSRSGFEADQISDLRGLSRRSPWLALVAMIMMFSLAGIPPTVGFYAKLSVLQAVVNAGQIWLAVLAVLASLVGAFYYLRVVKLMYFDEPLDTSPIEPARDARATLAVNGALVLALGVLPSPLLSACYDAVRQALAT